MLLNRSAPSPRLHLRSKLALLLLGWNIAFADPTSAPASATGVPAKLEVVPAVIDQDAGQDAVKTLVTLDKPAPCFFICELRSPSLRQLVLTDIIFKKGDLLGQGSCKVRWEAVETDCAIKVSAFSVDAPDLAVSCTVTLHRSREDSSGN